MAEILCAVAPLLYVPHFAGSVSFWVMLKEHWHGSELAGGIATQRRN